MVLTEDRSGIAFLTDCDYEVPLGTLNPRPNLVITENAALEADLFEAGGFEEIVVQLVPAALNDDEVTLEFAAQLKDRSVALAEALGRIRRVAKEHAFPLDLDNFRHHKYRKSGSSIVDVDKMVRAVIQASREATLTATEVADRVEKIPSSYSNCNGHDLVAAVAHVLREDFGVRGHTEDTVAAILRNSFIGETFERLRIVDRLRRWEVGNSRQLFI
jgi:hypothetical protein